MATPLLDASLVQSIPRDVALTLALTLVPYALLRGDLPPKRRGWIMSNVSSLTCSLVSIKHAVAFLASGCDASTLYTADAFSDFITTFFVTYLLIDLVVGSLDYPTEVDLLTGWIHHTVYIMLCSWGVLGRFTVVCSAMMPIEVPTFILARGHLFPSQRADLLFGLTFFLFRIVYFAVYATALFVHRDPPVGIRWAAPLIMVLHLHWFYRWCLGMMKRAKKSSEGASKAA